MRWVFYTLLMINLAYLPYGVVKALPHWLQGDEVTASVPAEAVAKDPDVRRLSVVPPVADTAVRLPQDGSRQLAGMCVLVGSWQQQADAQGKVDDLVSQGAQVVVRRIVANEPGLSWVYLPAYDSEAEALSALRALQRMGVDSFITRDGDRDNAISLGYFKNRDSARGVQQRLEREGYKASIRQMDREVTEFWLQFDESASTQANALLKTDARLSLKHAACETSLSGSN